MANMRNTGRKGASRAVLARVARGGATDNPPTRAPYATTELAAAFAPGGGTNLRAATLRLALIAIVLVMSASCFSGPPVLPHCVASEQTYQIPVVWPVRRDVLFVVSDAPSMAQEQALLQQQLPPLMRMLALGVVPSGDRFPPVDDLHVAVVSATRLAGAGVAPSRVLTSGMDACASDYPSFLRYHGPYFGIDRDDPSAFLADFGCNASLGSAGEGRNQALEAAVGTLLDPSSSAGFLRNDPRKGLSFISIVVVADSDDCSMPSDAATGDALPATTVACAQCDAELQSIEHYADALKALRLDPNLVTFSAITGVPPDLVSAAVLDKVNFSWEQDRDAFYQGVLNDPSMQVAADPSSPDRLRSACTSAMASAEPGRRLVRLAQRFGANGTVVSMCSDDWRSALWPLIGFLGGRPTSEVCIPRPLPRGPDGRVACKLYWDLPPPELAPEGTPTQCSDRPYLHPAGESHVLGGQRCEISQIAVTSYAELAGVDPQAGWYYDDFSKDVDSWCFGSKTRFVFTEFARPQAGVEVDLECHGLALVPKGDPAVDDIALCRAPETLQSAPPRFNGTPLVGQACMPAQIPKLGFGEREVYVETGDGQCLGGACMVYHVEGDPRDTCDKNAPQPQTCNKAVDPECVPIEVMRCADPKDTADRVYLHVPLRDR